MTTERICKYPGCYYYDKKAKHYCCGACACDHRDSMQSKSTITRNRKENVMEEIKREWSYKTSDGKLFTGKSAGKKAEDYQKRLNFRKNVRDIIPEAHKIFNINGPDPHEDGESDEEQFLDKVNDEFNWDNDNFEGFLYQLVTIYFGIPELPKFFQFIEEKFMGQRQETKFDDLSENSVAALSRKDTSEIAELMNKDFPKNLKPSQEYLEYLLCKAIRKYKGVDLFLKNG